MLSKMFPEFLRFRSKRMQSRNRYRTGYIFYLHTDMYMYACSIIRTTLCYEYLCYELLYVTIEMPLDLIDIFVIYIHTCVCIVCIYTY